MNTKQWISIGSPFIMKWKKIIIQGRGDEDQWVSGYKVSYTTDGKTFSFVEKGRVFEGNFDRHTKV